MDLVNIGLDNSLLHDGIKALHLKLSYHQYVCICMALHFISQADDVFHSPFNYPIFSLYISNYKIFYFGKF